MKNIIKLFSLLLIMQVNCINAQDIQFTQFYSSPLYLNPALTGASGCTRISLAYRNQWPGISKSYKTALLSVDHFIDSKNLGVGLVMGTDEAGTGSLKTTIINASLAYQVKLNRTYTLRFGLQPGVGIKKINFNSLLFGDQLTRGDKLGKGVASIEAQPQTKTYIDIGGGIFLTNSRCWIGASAYHLNKPNDSFYSNAKAIIPVKYSIHMGGKFLINKDEKYGPAQKYFSPAIHYKRQGEFDQVDVGFYYSQNIFNIGLWYRGIPGLKAYKAGYQNNDAFALILGLTTEKVWIGYSYDITISELAYSTQGAHELTLTYQICSKKKKKNYRLVTCPKF